MPGTPYTTAEKMAVTGSGTTFIPRRAARFLACVGLAGAQCLVIATACADNLQPIASLEAAASSALLEAAHQRGYTNIRVQLRPLDPHLALPLCDQPLETLINTRQPLIGTTSVGIQCAGSDPWTIYARAQVEADEQVPVLAVSIPRHHRISQADLDSRNLNLASVTNGSAVLRDLGQIVGMESVRPIQAGTPLRASDLRPARVIARGQTVLLISNAGKLEVRMQGKALKEAAAGERVTVVNLSSGKEVEGYANSDGSVTVP